MRKIPAALALLTVVAFNGQLRADDAAEAVVKKAIEATGGADALDKYQAGRITGTGTIVILGEKREFTMESVFHLPNKMKNTLDADFGDMTVSLKQVIAGKRVSLTMNGSEIKPDDSQMEELNRAVESQELYRLTPLLGDKYTLKKLDKAVKVGGEQATAVEVTRKGRKSPIILFFSKKSGLVVGAEDQGMSPDGGRVKERQVFKDHKKVQGVMQPTGVVITHDGDEFMTMDFKKIELLEKVDPKEFAIGDD